MTVLNEVKITEISKIAAIPGVSIFNSGQMTNSIFISVALAINDPQLQV